MTITPCPNCQSRNLYTPEHSVGSGGGGAPNYLPGLGGFMSSARFRVVVCADCGLTRLFAAGDALAKLSQSEDWVRLSATGSLFE